MDLSATWRLIIFISQSGITLVVKIPGVSDMEHSVMDHVSSSCIISNINHSCILIIIMLLSNSILWLTNVKVKIAQLITHSQLVWLIFKISADISITWCWLRYSSLIGGKCIKCVAFQLCSTNTYCFSIHPCQLAVNNKKPIGKHGLLFVCDTNYNHPYNWIDSIVLTSYV